MWKYLLRAAAVAGAAFLLVASAVGSAQPYERMLRHNFWNDGVNVAGLRQDSLSRANAEIGGSYEEGDFRSLHDPSSKWSVGASTRAVKHLKGYSLRGAFSFDNTENYDMCGSMFSTMGFYPVDAMEFTPGRKSSQTYYIDGGISVDVSSNWRIGIRAGMTSRNTAKLKDLRYTSYSLDLDVLPSVMYHSGEFAAGATLVYGRNTETVSAEQIGSSQNAPFAFFDEGLMFGTYQSWSGSGVHLKETGVSGLPLQRNSYGAALQAQYGGAFVETSAKYFSGHAGERQIVWYRFEGMEASALAGVRLGDGHSLRAKTDYTREVNRESVLEKVVENGITLSREYGSNRVFERCIFGAVAEYEYLGRALEVRASASGKRSEKLSSPYYPYVYFQGMNVFGFEAEGLCHISVFDVGVQASYLQGVISEDGERTVVSTSNPAPERMEELYSLMNEYDTVPRLSLGLSLRGNIRGGLYAELAGFCTKAFGVTLISGSSRWGGSLKLGYNF